MPLRILLSAAILAALPMAGHALTVDTHGDAVFDVLEGAGASSSISIVGPEAAPATDGRVLHEILAEVGVENDPGEVDISADATSTLSNPLGAAPAVLNFAFDALARAFGELPEGSAAVDVGLFEENIGTPLTSSAPLVALFEPGESFADDGVFSFSRTLGAGETLRLFTSIGLSAEVSEGGQADSFASGFGRLTLVAIEGGGVGEIPLPAGVWLLLSGLGAARRRACGGRPRPRRRCRRRRRSAHPRERWARWCAGRRVRWR